MSKKYWGLTRYHRSVLALYGVLLIAVVFFYRPLLNYHYSPQGLVLTLWIGGILLLLAALLNTLFGWIKKSPKKETIFPALCIALMFAIPEEVLFRGIIQGAITPAVGYIWLTIFLSSLVFGLAHLGNGAKSLSPRTWNWRFALLAFLGGIPLGILYAATGSLLFPTLLHFMILVVSQILVIRL